MTVKERLIKYLEYKQIGRNKFETTAGISLGYITNLKNAPKEQQLVKILQAAPDLDKIWLLTGEGSMIKGTPQPVSADKAPEMKRHYTQFANAGTLTEEEGTSYEMQPVIHQMPKYDFTIRIHGNSMSPTYDSGDIVACRDVSHTGFIQWGQIHVLSTSQGNIIKRLYDNEEGVECKSDNSDFLPFVVRRDEIYSIALVVGGLKMEHM